MAAIAVTSRRDVELPMEEGKPPRKLLKPSPSVRSLGEAARLSGRGPASAWYSRESSFREVRLPRLAAAARPAAWWAITCEDACCFRQSLHEGDLI